MTWRLDRNCEDKDVSFFFPSDRGGVKRAITVCSECNVRAECLEFAICNQITDGIWGGTTETSRIKLIRERFGRLGNVDFNYMAVK